MGIRVGTHILDYIIFLLSKFFDIDYKFNMADVYIYSIDIPEYSYVYFIIY